MRGENERRNILHFHFTLVFGVDARLNVFVAERPIENVAYHFVDNVKHLVDGFAVVLVGHIVEHGVENVVHKTAKSLLGVDLYGVEVAFKFFAWHLDVGEERGCDKRNHHIARFDNVSDLGHQRIDGVLRHKVSHKSVEKLRVDLFCDVVVVV